MILEQLIKRLESEKSSKSQVYKQIQELSRLDADQVGNLTKIKEKIKKISKFLDQSTESISGKELIIVGLQRYQEELNEAESQNRRQFGITLRKELLYLSLELTGQYPTLKAGLFTFKIPSAGSKVTIWYGSEQEKLAECNLKANEVKQKLERILQDLGTNQNQDIFIDKLKQAYSRAQDRDTATVPIIRVLPELAFLLQGERYYQDPCKENYRSYSRADFSYDLYRFGKSALTRGLQLTVAIKQYTRSRHDFLWIPNNNRGEGTAYSHLQFKE
jgi:hypothetical protein